MSRIGRAPIAVPAGVTVTVGEENLITVKGPKGTLTYKANPKMTVAVEGAVVTVTRPNDDAENRALHGLTRTLINNMVIGVSAGYEKKLEIVGVGYRAAKTGNKITLNLGHSHPIYFEETDMVKFDVPDANTIIVKSYDKSGGLHVRRLLDFEELIPVVSIENQSHGNHSKDRKCIHQ